MVQRWIREDESVDSQKVERVEGKTYLVPSRSTWEDWHMQLHIHVQRLWRWMDLHQIPIYFPGSSAGLRSDPWERCSIPYFQCSLLTKSLFSGKSERKRKQIRREKKEQGITNCQKCNRHSILLHWIKENSCQKCQYFNFSAPFLLLMHLHAVCPFETIYQIHQIRFSDIHQKKRKTNASDNSDPDMQLTSSPRVGFLFHTKNSQSGPVKLSLYRPFKRKKTKKVC